MIPAFFISNGKVVKKICVIFCEFERSARKILTSLLVLKKSLKISTRKIKSKKTAFILW